MQCDYFKKACRTSRRTSPRNKFLIRNNTLSILYPIAIVAYNILIIQLKQETQQLHSLAALLLPLCPRNVIQIEHSKQCNSASKIVHLGGSDTTSSQGRKHCCRRRSHPHRGAAPHLQSSCRRLPSPPLPHKRSAIQTDLTITNLWIRQEKSAAAELHFPPTAPFPVENGQGTRRFQQMQLSRDSGQQYLTLQYIAAARLSNEAAWAPKSNNSIDLNT